MNIRRLSLATASALLLVSGLALAQQSSTPAAASAPAPAAEKSGQRTRLDANGDGVIDRTEAAAHPRLAARFDALDANKDGRLTAGERPASRGEGRRPGRGHAGHGRRFHGEGRAHMPHGLDRDKDGRISRAEAAADSAFAARFAERDANNDGYIDQADRQVRRQQRLAQWFADADGNKDGQLSRAEFEATHAAGNRERGQREQQKTRENGRTPR